ncbi:tetratricopeptide repeat protein [Clostridium tyrobutyricum]|uniref:Uncharacterized protein n=2 Tax=Clostridium tyrobutyricum TaxID=1519 RepID=W6N7K9_CLOTY|nr:tetratricopeptide repeat protein [Clostridium tyrobutyricum]AND83530.1 hypothetical protein CTK_C02600 [Clostridium tyrobutyricum]ANP68319.1 hypothetical protein BA182_01115 [Clostridium tyrobutyricum]MBV4433165.1 tetratricopeptide repeat protein [Clostridium tyrobutyricum]QNB67336.1 tetratricopeptide repeat protein [Clostridium tyrobutyricum]CDL91344.1 hypothetical protein CTDIVETGP_1414 [Clostridium tyrobutyricum DIVETGP]
MINFFKKLKNNSYNNKDNDAKFHDDLRELYNNFSLRIDPEKWDALIHNASNKYNWYMDIMGDKLMHFLMSNYNLPYQIWTLLDQHFQWKSGSRELSKSYPKDFIQFVISNINNQYRLRYDLFKSKINGSYDDFINLYYKAYFSLQNKNLHTAQKSILQAKQIFDGHPDLIILEGSYHVEINRIDKAIENFSHVINKDDNDFYAHLNRADTYIKSGKLSMAYEDYRKCLSIDPENTRVQYQLGDCCLYMGNYQEAKDIYTKILSKYPNDKLISQNLNSACDFLEEELKCQS